MSNFPILLDGPQASPAKCGVCGYPGKDRRFLSTEVDFDFYGVFILCEQCVVAAGNDFGMISPEQAKALADRTEAAEAELVTLRAAVTQLETLGDIVAALVGSNANSDVDADSVAVRGDESADSVSEGSDSLQGLLDFDLDEQGSGEGPDDLSTLTTANRNLNL